MNDDVQKALDAASAASQNSEQLEMMRAAMLGQAMGQAMAQAMSQQQAQHSCQHSRREPVNVGKWLAIGGAACLGGLGLAVGFLAVAIAAPCATVCLLILRSVWRDMRDGRR
ncbi:hypothetical protein [Streptomyces chartreusis]|uniref:hypothetical protein n=1 Tax=Streptomyces chartreusis TaxID=1969 RepID=UPI00362ABB0A